jgi:hypothetical protein
MTQQHYLITDDANNSEQLKIRLLALQDELANILQKTTSFEAILRSHLENEIIEEHELNALYKQLQRAKKEQRLAQKMRGKNFKQKEGLKILAKTSAKTETINDVKERKRLYREAMLFTHPDTFSMQEDIVGLATEITAKLIEIYQYGSLEKLKDYHAHICSGNAFLTHNILEIKVDSKLKDNYLEKEIIEVEQQLAKAKNKQTYKVLTTYKNPMSFIDELKIFYADRIFKLKKRTRKVKK